MKFLVILTNLILFCKIIKSQSHRQNCGLIRSESFAYLNKGFSADEINHGDWPWLVAFYDSFEEYFFCAGSLISKRHVLTVAHTFQNKDSNETFPPEKLLAIIGKHDLRIIDEINSQNTSVSDIFIHPDWSSEATSFDADIAVVVLSKTVEFSYNIQPVCLPQQSSADVIGDGMVVGWGKSEHSGNAFDAHENIPREMNIPSINSSYCYPRFPQLALYSSHRMFCGGYDFEGKGPCSGDSGGGFYTKQLGMPNHVVTGTVSASLIDEMGRCDVNKYSLYTNVAWFVNWIVNVTKNEVEIIKKHEYVSENKTFTARSSVRADVGRLQEICNGHIKALRNCLQSFD